MNVELALLCIWFAPPALLLIAALVISLKKPRPQGGAEEVDAAAADGPVDRAA